MQNLIWGLHSAEPGPISTENRSPGAQDAGVNSHPLEKIISLPRSSRLGGQRTSPPQPRGDHFGFSTFLHLTLFFTSRQEWAGVTGRCELNFSKPGFVYPAPLF